LRFVVAYPLVLFLAWRSGSIARAFIVTQLACIVLVGGDRFPGYRFAIVLWPILAVAAARGSSRREPGAFGGWRRVAVLLFAAAGALLALWPRVALPLAESIAGLERLQRPVASYAELLAREIRHAGVVALALAVWLATHRLRRTRPGAALALLVACTLLPSGFDPALRTLRAPDPSARLGRIVGLWMHAHLPPGTLVATNAAGALPYFSDLPVVDMLGLTDRHIARSAAERSAWIGHERGDAAYVLRRAPDLILFGGPEGAVDPWPFPGDRALAQDPEFRVRYGLERVPFDGFELVFYRRRDTNSGRP
jgi:hypothetical protein